MTRPDYERAAGVLDAADRFEILANEGADAAASLLSGEYCTILRETVKELGLVCTAAREAPQ